MAGSSPLTSSEERKLVRHIRRINSRDRALVSAQLFPGFRISEVLALTIGHVWNGARVRERVAPPPRFLKGGCGTTRTIPIGPGLRRALEHYLAQRGRHRRHEHLNPNAPLFLSPRAKTERPFDGGKNHQASLGRRVRRPAGPFDAQFEEVVVGPALRGERHDLLVVRDGLGHRSVAVTQGYLPTDQAKMEDLILQSDWTRSKKPASPKTAATVSPPVLAAKPQRPRQGQAPCLPGFEDFAA